MPAVSQRGEDWATTPAHDAPLPASGERVTMPLPGSSLRKPPAPLTGAQEKQIADAQARRAAWEASPEGQARSRTISDFMLQEHGIHATAGQIYDDLMRSGALARQTGPRHYDVQLPGMADPDAAPRPARWEELPEAVQQHTDRMLAMQGTSRAQMAADFGAQHDQAVVRMLKAGHTDPYAATFYSTGDPRRVIRESARELGIPEATHAQLNAFTSPNTKFTHVLKSGEVTYPNDMAAKHAALHAMQQKDPALLRTNPESREMRSTGLLPYEDTRRVQGYPANLEKAAQAMHQHEAGISPADWKTGEGAGPMGRNVRMEGNKEVPLGKDPWRYSPKTGPYANSWSDTHPQFTVSDIHTGGGGFVPHLSSFKGVSGEKSEREKAIDAVTYFHASGDVAARQAMMARGLPSVRQTQAGQWGEEQLQRGEEAAAKGWPSQTAFMTPAMAYPSLKAAPPVAGPGEISVSQRIGHQPTLFNEDFSPSQSLVPPRYGVNAMGTRRTRRAR